MSPPACALRSRTNSGTEPSIAVDFAHWACSGEDVATYFWVLLMNVAKGSMSDAGQNSAHSSYMRRPSSTASWVSMTSLRCSCSSSSKSSKN